MQIVPQNHPAPKIGLNSDGCVNKRKAVMLSASKMNTMERLFVRAMLTLAGSPWEFVCLAIR